MSEVLRCEIDWVAKARRHYNTPFRMQPAGPPVTQEISYPDIPPSSSSQSASEPGRHHPAHVACPLNWVTIKKTHAAVGAWAPEADSLWQELRYVRKKGRLWSQRGISDGFVGFQNVCGLRLPPQFKAVYKG